MIKSVEKKYEYDGVWHNNYILTYTNGETWNVPQDTANRHYQEILEWVAEGNTITDNGGGE